jgi:hypothetical protein
MKRTLLFFSLLATAAYGQDCSELFISEYVEGTGNNKAIELYNPTGTAISLTGYTIERHSNGSSNASGGGTLTLAGTIQPHDVFVIVNGQTTTSSNSPACDPALQAMADQLDGVYPAPTYMNGNDAIVLKKNGTMIDIFGKSGDASMSTAYGWSDQFPYDGSAGVIWTENHSLIRKATVKKGVTANPSTFIVTQEYDSLSVNNWSNLGTHTCNCALGLAENTAASFVVFPNPSENGTFSVQSSEIITAIEVIDYTGRIIYTEETAAAKMVSVATSSIDKGMYVLRIRYNDNTFSQSNIIIR